MRNLLKLIKNLSFLLCFGLYLLSATSLAMAEVQNSEGKFYSESKGKYVDWSELSADEKNRAANFAVIENATGKDKVEAAKKKLDEAKASGNAAQIQEAQAAYDQAQTIHQEALNTFLNQSNLSNKKREGASAQNYNQKANDARDAAKETEKRKNDVEQAAANLVEAQKSGDQEKIIAAQQAYKKAQSDLNSAENDQKQKEKEAKDAKKEYNKDKKAAEKQEKKDLKAIEKEQKNAQKDLDKANKEINKLQEKCAKGKCSDKDMQKLAEAQAKADNAQIALDTANQKAYAYETAQNQISAENSYKDAQEATVASDNTEALIAQADKDLAEAQSKAPQMCSADEIGGNVFLLIACKATTTLADLRVIAYIISGFGMVALAYAAIFGKMNWKHLANIGIGLFLLSMMTPFIEYFTTGKDNTLRFGKYLPAGFTDIQGSDGTVEDCGKVNIDGKTSSLCEVLVTAEVKKEKWSLKDLKGSITAGLNAVRNASDMYKAAKSTVSNVKSAVSNMTAQIKSGGGGLDGIINAAGAVANATGTIVNSGQVLANNIATNAGNLSNNIRDAGSTNQDREAREKHEAQLDALNKKCSAGNCSDKEKEALTQLQEVVENEKTGVDKWLENDGAGGGSTILSGINKVGNIANNASNSVKNVANAANEGQAIGGNGALGSILGIGFGVGTAVTEGMDTAEKSKENGMFDFRSNETKREEEYKNSSDYVKNKVEQNGKIIETRGDGSIKTTNKDGTVTITNQDGSSIVTKADGSTTTVDANGKRTTTYQNDPNKKVVVNADGSKVITDSAGNQITYNAAGKVVDTQLVDKYKRQTSESIQEALNGKKEEEKPATTSPVSTPETSQKEEATKPSATTPATSSSKGSAKECATLKEDKDRALREYRACTAYNDGRDCNPYTEKFQEFNSAYKEKCS